MERIKVSENQRHFITADGKPFFWLADTAWELFHRLSLKDASYYLQTRSQQGFNVVQAVVLAELDGLDTPNVNGDLPLDDHDPEHPNEAYFRHVDAIIAEAAVQKLYMALLPTWGDKVSIRYPWAVGPKIFNEQNARRYGQWLAERYKDLAHIIWVLGGDRNPDPREVAIWSAMAEGIINADPVAIISFHPQPFDGNSSSGFFHQAGWLSFNMQQTGHNKYTPVDEYITRDYARMPIKPVLNGEPTYEAHPLSFQPSEGYSSDTEIRRDAWCSVFSGACGHTYGCHSVWQFYEPGRAGINHPILHWRTALQLAGARQMTHLHKLIMSHAPLKRVPAHDLLIHNDPENSGDRIVATRADDGSYAYIYSAAGKKIVVNTAVLTGSRLQVYWLSPKDGTTTLVRELEKKDCMEFVPPNSGEGNDWVLIIKTHIP